MPNSAQRMSRTHFLPRCAKQPQPKQIRVPSKKMTPLIAFLGLVFGLLVVLELVGGYRFVALGNRMRMFEGFSGGANGAATPEPQGSVAALTDSGAKAMDVSAEKLIASTTLVPMTTQEASDAWGKMTSEKCFRSDVGEPLKKTRNYLQRTNNYPRSHPDSCSAPNHEFIGTFYRPHEGVGATPATGLPYPRGALAQ